MKIAILFFVFLTTHDFRSCGMSLSFSPSIDEILISGGWRTAKELATYTEDDKRNTLIVEMNKHSTNTITELQAKSTYGALNSLVGMGAICIFLRDMKIRCVDELQKMSDHDQRNTLIVELNRHFPYTIPQLQAKEDLELVDIGGNDRSTFYESIDGLEDVTTAGDALVAGKWRTVEQMKSYSEDDKRNTLIVELNKHSSMTIGQLQGKSTTGNLNSLVGMAGITIVLRNIKIRCLSELKTMSDQDQRNTLIVELDIRTGNNVPYLQSKGDMELVNIAVQHIAS